MKHSINIKMFLLIFFCIILLVILFLVINTIYYNLNKNKIWNKQEIELLKIIEQNPNDDKVYSDLGTVYIFKRKFDTAEDYFNKSINLNKNNFDANNWLIYIYAKKGDVNNAINKSKELIEKFPSNETVYGNLGSLYEYKKDYINAITFFVKQKYLLQEDLRTNKIKYDPQYINIKEKYIIEIDSKIKKLEEEIKFN